MRVDDVAGNIWQALSDGDGQAGGDQDLSGLAGHDGHGDASHGLLLGRMQSNKYTNIDDLGDDEDLLQMPVLGRAVKFHTSVCKHGILRRRSV